MEANYHDKILGKKIKTVHYSEANEPNGQFYFEGFDVFDLGINVEMEDGFSWNLSWQEDEYFNFGIGKHLPKEEIKTWESTERWKPVINSIITHFRIAFIDKSGNIPSMIEIEFENKKKICIKIGEEYNSNDSIQIPFEYDFGGEIYVFHDEKLLQPTS